MPQSESTSDQLRLAKRISHENAANLTTYQRDLVEWGQNVDRRYAWVILFALWLIMSATYGTYRIYGLIFARVISDGQYTREEATWPVSMSYTAENVLGVFVSILVYHMTYQQSMLIGGLLLILGNGLATWSSSLVLDVLLLGVVQGIGYAFIFMPFMDIINSYFLKYRTFALGFALSGGTVSVFGLSVLFQWLLDNFTWRYSYLGIAAVCLINLLMVPLLRQNTKPQWEARMEPTGYQIETLSAKLSSSSPVTHQQGQSICADKNRQFREQFREEEQVEVKPSSGKYFDRDLFWSILKTPAFHLIWYTETTYYWLVTIYYLIIVDYGLDKGCTNEETDFLLKAISIGELFGRMVLTILVDMQFLSNRSVVTLIMLLLAGLLTLITQVSGFIWLSATIMAISTLISLLYVLVNGLLVDYLGDRQVILGYGMASCISGLLMFFRPQAVGYFRDHLGTYEPLMVCLGAVCALGATLWIFEPMLTECAAPKRRNQRDIIDVQSLKVT